MVNLPLLLLALAVPTSGNVFSRSADFARRQTTGLARDLRVAFGGVVAPRDTPAHRVIYCKNSASVGTLEGSDPSSNSSSGTGAQTTGSVKGSSTTKKATGTGTASGSSPTSPWSLTKEYSGSSFFDDWNFWDTSDPTHGTVNYLSRSDGESAGLVDVNDAGHAIMRVETTQTVSNTRKSIRITTKDSFEIGTLIIGDFVHMPTGCATWPAFWTNGPGWPTGGEIDIVEGVNDYTNNQATIHTAPGCSLPTDDPSDLGASASAVTGGTDCAAVSSGNQGCGMRSRSDVSFGPGFNSNGGGVYAMKWDSSGISVYFFARDNIPDDILANSPLPSNWGIPFANWPAEDCSPTKYFYDHVAIFDTTLCGDWAGSAWTGSGIPGQEQSCAQRTGYSTCDAFVRGSGSSFESAYWEVKSVKVYN